MSKVTAFRKAVQQGRKQLKDTLAANERTQKVTFKVLVNGKIQEHELEVHMKPWSIKEYIAYQALQWTVPEKDDQDPQPSGIDARVASVIVGALDEDGERIFEVEDQEMLSVLNVGVLAKLSREILQVAEVDVATQAAEK